MKPKLPKGYRWLRVGQKRPAVYRTFSAYTKRFVRASFCNQMKGEPITEQQMMICGPYIAPIRKRRGRK